MKSQIYNKQSKFTKKSPSFFNVFAALTFSGYVCKQGSYNYTRRGLVREGVRRTGWFHF